MTQEEFYYYCKTLPFNDYIVKILSKYSHEKVYRKDQVLLSWDPDVKDFVWDWDWDEGQQDIIIAGIISIDDIDIPDNLKR